MENIVETKDCAMCGTQFSVTDWDLDFYKQINVPSPRKCPHCRQQTRTSFLNQINLFKRKCDATGKDIISNYPPEIPFKVYQQEYWNSDENDTTKHGRDFDFDRPFFEQYKELMVEVPLQALFNNYLQDENCDYTHCAGKNKNCYLIFDSDENKDCLYSYGMNGSRDSIDQYRVQNMQLSYECIDSKDCYKCYYTHNSHNCSDSIFLNNCIGCKKCIYCSNLNNKEYHIFNEPVEKEKYEEIMQQLGSYQYLQDKLPQFKEFRLKFPQKFRRGVQNENVTGNHIVNSKDAFMCFDSMKIWTGKYCTQVFIGAKNCMDIHESGECELNYETANCAYNIYNCYFCFQCMNQNTNLQYCMDCHHCQDCFGCCGLKRQKYCIFNKKYSPEEYATLRDKIIEHMRSTKEYGEFFPTELSHTAYNLAIAQEYFPLTKEQALEKGFTWRDPDKKEFKAQSYEIPDNIKDVDPSITNEILACEECKINYKIQEAELKIYKTLNLPIPRKCFLCRHQNRLSKRTPRNLWERNCDKCGVDIKTAYPPEWPDIVYCEDCYQKSLS
jgi:hypothetical protein